MRQTLKTIVGAAGVIVILMGWSYVWEWPKYHFEKTALEVGRRLPGARLIKSTKADSDALIAFIWPITAGLTYAIPDPVLRDRFITVTMTYDEPDPTTFLIDVDCKTGDITWYDLDEPENAFPARDLYGQPVVAPNGQTYRRDNDQMPAPPGWLQPLCKTDWTAERKAVQGH